jgi:uncharacterized protein YecE (DUF72 family)
MPRNTDPAYLERRAKREARRQKQREQNVYRAQKMHVARLEYEAQPKKKSTRKADLPALHVGCSGWFYWHWRELFYPQGLSPSGWFNHYAKTFDTVELNAPFYSWPTVGTVNTWLRQAGRKRFIYTVKASELITHTKRFRGTKELVKDFGLIADLLGPRMGCFLFQLPPSFNYTPTRLRMILGQLDPRHRNVVEFRHKSWWNDAVYTAFRKSKAIFCSCSGPRLPDDLVKTANDVYIRFHGASKWYRHDYTKEELAVWVSRIKQSKAKRVWAYFNNDREAFAIKNAKEFMLQMMKH